MTQVTKRLTVRAYQSNRFVVSVQWFTGHEWRILTSGTFKSWDAVMRVISYTDAHIPVIVRYQGIL